MRQTTELATPDRCALAAPVFTALGPAVFRRAESDGVPAMVVPLGEVLAVLPLAAVQRVFGIAEASPDGRMLALIAASLDFVAGLRLGDRLPPEVLTGRPGWSPAPRHLHAARERLRRAGTAPCAAAALVEELACLEALRETLLRPVLRLPVRLRALAGAWRGHAERRATLAQVRRLAEAAAHRLAAEFRTATRAALTAACADDDRLAAIRAARDRLCRLDRAFLPVLAEWNAAPSAGGDPWPRLVRTYRFLAPRFMAAEEWERATRPAGDGAAPAPPAAMTW